MPDNAKLLDYCTIHFTLIAPHYHYLPSNVIFAFMWKNFKSLPIPSNYDNSERELWIIPNIQHHTTTTTYPNIHQTSQFWHEHAAFQRSAFRWSTAGNDAVAPILIRLLSSVFLCSPFSLLLPFLIEGTLGSKTYLPKVGQNAQKPAGTPLSRPRQPLTRGWSPTKDGHPPEGRRSARIKKLI